MEITTRTIHSRCLLRPSREVNEILVGVLAKALETHEVRLHAVVALSTHMHLILSPASVAEMAAFMKFVNGNISREIGRIHDWPGTLWARRYTSIPISEEPEAQIARLKYILSQGCKEGLVASPIDWPGVHSADALASGRPLEGVWTDRTSFDAARRRRQGAKIRDFQESLRVHLEPLPCWRHLDDESRRAEVRTLVDQIEKETQRHHRSQGTRPLGARAVRRVHPHRRPLRENRAPAPLVHAATRRTREALREAYSRFVHDYTIAAERLRSGDLTAVFPPDCFPPALPPRPP